MRWVVLLVVFTTPIAFADSCTSAFVRRFTPPKHILIPRAQLEDAESRWYVDPGSPTKFDRRARLDRDGYEFMRGLSRLTREEEAEIYKELERIHGRTTLHIILLEDGRWVRKEKKWQSGLMINHTTDLKIPTRLFEFLVEREKALRARFGPQFNDWRRHHFEIRIGVGPRDRFFHSEGRGFTHFYSTVLNVESGSAGTYGHGIRGNIFETGRGDDLLMDGERLHAPPPQEFDPGRVFVRSQYRKPIGLMPGIKVFVNGELYFSTVKSSEARGPFQ